jgi:hypothetical protein
MTAKVDLVRGTWRPVRSMPCETRDDRWFAAVAAAKSTTANGQAHLQIVQIHVAVPSSQVARRNALRFVGNQAPCSVACTDDDSMTTVIQVATPVQLVMIADAAAIWLTGAKWARLAHPVQQA